MNMNIATQRERGKERERKGGGTLHTVCVVHSERESERLQQEAIYMVRECPPYKKSNHHTGRHNGHGMYRNLKL